MPRDLFSQSVLAVALLILAVVPGANAQKDDDEETGAPPTDPFGGSN